MAKKKEVVITCNATNVKAVIEGLERGMAALAKEEEKLLGVIKQRGYAENDEKKRLKELERAMDAMRTNVQKNREEQKKLGEVMKDLAGAKLKDLKKALQEGKNALNNMSARDPNREKLINDLKRIKEQIDANTGAVQKNTSAWGALGTTLKNLVAYAGVFAMFNKIKSLMGEMITKNREFSDQLANVRKVSNLAMDDINKLAKSLSKIDSRTSLEGLMELSYTGAKLGFGNYGIEGLESFAKSAVKVQNALSEDMGADSMTALSKMVEVMGLIPKMGVERAMDATGSAIFKLASTSTATGTNIVEFSKRLMGLANIAHITTPELLAIGSAADSMALMPEVAATAFNKLITAMQKQPNLIEDALKIDKGTISDLYQAGRMTDAMVMVFEKMREKGGMNALMQSGVFKDLGSDGARLVAVMATMANRVDMLNAHLAVSRQAFEEGTAVAQEYAIQMDTAAAYSERAANIWEKAFVNPEGVDIVKELSKAWYEVSKSLTENEKIMFGVKVSLQGIILLLKTLLQLLPEIIFTLGIAGMASMWTKMREGEGILASLTSWFGKLTAAQKVFFKAAGWVGLAITIFEVGKAVYDLANKTKEANIYMKDFNNSLSDLNTESSKAELELKRYRKAIDEANVGSKQRLAAINTFNSKFSPYLKNLLTEKSTAKDVADAYEAVNRAMRTKLALQLKEKDINQQVLPREQWTAERRTEYDKRVKAAGMGEYGSGWITGYAQDNANKSVDAMVRDIGKRYYNLPDKIIDEIAKQAAAGNTDFNNYGNIINSRYLQKANALLGANAYLRQDRAAQNAMRRVNQKWAPEQKAMDDYLAAQQQDEQIQPLEPLPPKGSKGGPKVPKWMRDEKQEAERSTKAVIGAIEEFYRLQEAAANELAANGQLEGKDFDMLIKHIQDRKDKMLLEARRTIVGDKNSWDDIKQTLDQDLVKRDSDISLEAIKRIQSAEPAKQGAVLRKYDGSAAVFGLDSNAWLNDIRKNAAQNELNIQRRQAAIAQEIDKILLQYQFVEQSQRDFGNKLVTLGLVTDGYQKVVKQLADGTEITANTKEVSDFANKVVGLGSKLYGVNPEDSAQLQQLMQTVMTNGEGGREEFASIFPNLDKWLQQPEQYKDEMQAMYELMIQYEGIYYDKLKQRDDLQNKRLNSWWEHSDEKKGNDQRMRDIQLYDFQYNTMKQGETMGYMMGLTNDVSQDPEVLREQAILEAKMAIWEKAKEEREAGLISEEVYQQRLRDMQDATMAYTEKIMQNINKRIDRLHKFEKPVIDMAGNVGKKLGEMIAGAEKDSMTWSEIWKSMALAVAESVIDMGAQYAQNLIMEKSMNAQSKNEALSKATVDVAAGTASGAAKTIGTLGWWGIALIPVIVALLKGLLQSAFSSSNENASATTASNVNRKLVSGMLTYDSGNITATTPVASAAGRKRRYIGQDGRVYTAIDEPAPKDGLVTQPIATTVQGQPALVAERGPEIVIGRETTRAIMMNEPQLIKYLADYGKTGGFAGGWRPFDTGNVTSPVLGGSAADNDNTDMRKAMSEMREVMTGVLYYLQHPVRPKIDMWSRGGEDGLYDSIQKADKFMSKYKP